MTCVSCSNPNDFEYKGKGYCYPHYLAQIANDPPTKPVRERPDDIRLLQHVFNVLLHARVLEFEFSDDGETVYRVVKTDPFYIEDAEYRKMERTFELSTGTKAQQR